MQEASYRTQGSHGLSPVCNLAGAHLMMANIDKLVQQIETLQVKVKTLEELPVGHDERLRLPMLDAQLAAILGEKLLLMQQLQGAMPALCATHELCLLLLCVPHTSACRS